MANPATPADIAARWRPLTPAEQVVAQALLDDAWAILLTKVPNLEERIAAGDLSSEVVIAVLCAMVLRVLRNPEGLRQRSVDDYTEVRDNAISTGALYLSDDELDLLLPAASGAFTIRHVPEPFCTTRWPG